MNKNKWLIFPAMAFILFACNDDIETNTAETKKDTAVIAVDPPVSETTSRCFAQQNAKDTFQLNLKVQGNRANGTLVYLFKEKDSNRGEITGTISGDTLIADYTFNSEGMSSVRQVAFLIKEDKATEGYGDLEQKDGKMVFKDLAKISFGKGIVMSKTECK